MQSFRQDLVFFDKSVNYWQSIVILVRQELLVNSKTGDNAANTNQ